MHRRLVVVEREDGHPVAVLVLRLDGNGIEPAGHLEGEVASGNDDVNRVIRALGFTAVLGKLRQELVRRPEGLHDKDQSICCKAHLVCKIKLIFLEKINFRIRVFVLQFPNFLSHISFVSL